VSRRCIIIVTTENGPFADIIVTIRGCVFLVDTVVTACIVDIGAVTAVFVANLRCDITAAIAVTDIKQVHARSQIETALLAV